MPQICTVCRHPKRPEIDRALLAGEPLRNIAKRVSLSPTALFRHKAHVEKRLVEARERDEAAQDRDLTQELVRLARRADGLASKAERDGDLRTALQGIRELSRLLELEARLAGQIGAAGVRIDARGVDRIPIEAVWRMMEGDGEVIAIDGWPADRPAISARAPLPTRPPSQPGEGKPKPAAGGSTVTSDSGWTPLGFRSR